MAEQQQGWMACPACRGEDSVGGTCRVCTGIGQVTAAHYAMMLRGDAFRLVDLNPPHLPLASLREGARRTVEKHCAGCGVRFVAPDLWMLKIMRCDPCQEAFAAAADADEVVKRRAAWDERVERWAATFGAADRRYAACRFETFGQDVAVPVRAAFRRVRDWADAWDWREPAALRGLLLHSTGKGTGKTHLLAALTRRVLERCAPTDAALLSLAQERSALSGGPAACPVRFWTAGDLLLRIGQARRPVRFDSDAPPPETEEGIYQALATVRLLVIDDLGQAPSVALDRGQEPVWEKIIGDRYNTMLPVIVATNLSVPDELRVVIGERAASRLQEMADFVSVNGQDYRQRRRG